MKSVKILLSMAESVKKFVAIVSKYPYDIDLHSGRFVIDAKSLLGIFSLDLSKPIELQAYCKDDGTFAAYKERIKEFLLEE